MNIRSFVKKIPVVKSTLAVLLSFIAFRCIETPLEPIMPASDIQMSIPIIDRTRTVADMMGKDTSKVKQNGAGYYYQDDRTYSPTQISTLSLSPQALTNQASLGTLTVPGVTLPTQTAASPLPPAIYPGSTASSLTLPSATANNSGTINFIVINNGTASLTITNNLPVGISFPQSITLKNNKTTVPVDTNVIATFPIPPISKRSSFMQTVPLTGKTLRGLLKTDPVTINTSSSPGPDTVKTGDGVSFAFSTTTLTSDSLSAVIPSAQLVAFRDSVITIDPTQVLEQATFSQGQFNLSITNNVPDTVGAQLKFSNFVSTAPTHDTLVINAIIVPNGQFTQNINLNTLQILNGDLSRPGTTMKFSVAIKTINSGKSIATVTKNDFVSASFTPLQTFVVKSLTGTINPMTLAINTGVNLGGLGQASKNFGGSFSFDSVQMNVKLGLSGGFPVYHHLALYARKFTSPTFDSLVITPGIVLPSLSTPGVITLGNAQDLSAFLGQTTSSFPDTMFVRGYVVVDSGRVSGTIYDTTKVYPSMSTIIPMKLGLLGGQYADVTPIEGKFDSSFVADTKSGRLYFSITNGLPLTLTFRAAFMGMDTVKHKRDTLLIIQPNATYSMYTIAGAQVDPVTGIVSQAQPTAFNIGLVSQQIQALAASDSVYIKVGMGTSGYTTPTVQAVRIRQTDNIRIRASANMVYTVNKKK